MIALPPGPFELVYADPPWTYRDKAKAGNRGAESHYSCMSIADICALPVADICAPNCLLALWWVAPMPREALAVVDAWGFELRTMKGLTWHKETKTGKSFFGMGNWTRANTEDLLFATRGKPKRVNAGVRQFMSAERPARHSEKPQEARDRLVALMGDVRRVELFARDSSPGWTVWGDQAPG